MKSLVDEIKLTFHYSEGLQDLGQWNAQMTAKVGYPMYGAIVGEIVTTFKQVLTAFRSDAAPVNSFPRNNTETTIGSQWVSTLRVVVGR
ncbi:hypothetical protein M422DRAFT_257431 [Sphaerobolus stellatus SS14]|uniref:Uncharacterized protein n=1 Tax=Sphaerobolus stellatus (strain SS14) TaxID=990650 RepID=A0A0C9VP16_SPHS4|nr:hypothetical protein M422DRAFT_257431 [Sphaerobolus stellatus SS14]